MRDNLDEEKRKRATKENKKTMVTQTTKKEKNSEDTGRKERKLFITNFMVEKNIWTTIKEEKEKYGNPHWQQIRIVKEMLEKRKESYAS